VGAPHTLDWDVEILELPLDVGAWSLELFNMLSSTKSATEKTPSIPRRPQGPATCCAFPARFSPLVAMAIQRHGF